jgi:tetratricopeptide (TPR) repeat protein
MRRLLIVLLFVPLALAQRHRLTTFSTETPEGALLQQIGQEPTEAKKLELIEQFVAKFPAHEATPWVLVQLQAGYMKSNQFDKALEAGEKLLKLDPLDAEVAHQNLKAAEAKKDPALVIRWSGETAQIAEKVVATPQPKDEDAVEEWKRQLEFSKQVVAYTEYSLYAMALQVQEPREQAGLIEALEQRSPKSQYLAQARPTQFSAYLRMGDMAKAVTAAEKGLETDPNNPDMLLVVAGAYQDQKREPEKVIAYTNKLIELTTDKPAPQGVVAEDWNKRQRILGARAWWIQGMQYFNAKKLKDADASLRKALPLVDDPNLKAGTLFHLGLIAYQTKNIVDAVKFNEQCAAIPSPYQAQAQQNLKAIRAQYRAVK